MKKVEHIVGMKKLVFVLALVCAVSAFGQDTKVSDSKTGTLITKNWSEFVGPTEGPRGFKLFSKDMKQNSDGQYEMWIKIIPNERSVFTKRYEIPSNTAYVLQYATVDCSKRLMAFEKTTLYDADDALVKSESTTLSAKTTRDKVRTGSIGAVVFEKICLEP